VFRRALARIYALFLPFATIARELQILRELYELELAAHTDRFGNPDPIRRVTETPGRRDTIVTYAGDDEKSRAVDEVLENALDDEEDEL
jgi:hypothetical protein